MLKITKPRDDSRALEKVRDDICVNMIHHYMEHDISAVRGAALCEVEGIPTIVLSLSCGAAYLLPQLPDDMRQRMIAEYRNLVRDMDELSMSAGSPFPEAMQISFAMSEYKRYRKKLSMIPIITIHVDGQHIVCRGGMDPDDMDGGIGIEVPLNNEEEAFDICSDLLDRYIFAHDAWMAYTGVWASLWLEQCAQNICMNIPCCRYIELRNNYKRHFGFLIMLQASESLSVINNNHLLNKCAQMLGDWKNPGGYACFLLTGSPNPLNHSCEFKMRGPFGMDYVELPENAWKYMDLPAIWSLETNMDDFGPAAMDSMRENEIVFAYTSEKAACAILDIFGIEAKI